MSVNYVTVKSSLKSDDATNSKYIKIIKSERINKYKVARMISDQCTLTEADVIAVLQAYETNLKMHFANGNSVELFNLGTLKPCFKADYDKDGNVIKSSLRLSKVRLITADIFIKEANRYHYKYCGNIDYGDNGFEKRAQILIDYLNNNKPYISTTEYTAIAGCSRATAKRDLELLYAGELIDRDKVGTGYVYRMRG